jgi:uncharacterized membrane protein (UPF0182 family)
MEERVITAGRERHRRVALVVFAAVIFIALACAGWAASRLIDYSWWKEMGQVNTWLDLYAWSTMPWATGTIVAWIVLLITHARAVRFAGGRTTDYPIYSRVAALALLGLSAVLAAASVDSTTVMRFVGSRSLADSGMYHDPIFGKSASFYLFDLPFWGDLRGYVFALVILAILVYLLVARGWQLRFTLPDLGHGPVDLSFLKLQGGLESKFLRFAGAFFLLAIAVRYYLDRFAMVWNQHRFLTGIDYTDDHFVLPLNWVAIAAFCVGAALVTIKKWLPAAIVVGASLLLLWIVPSVASSVYVKPNEISLERPYIEKHIAATREAYGLTNKIKEVELRTDPNASIDTSKNRDLLDNVRLWDWKPFHDTITQMQALRPYYAFHEPPDVDRYMIDGQKRQVLLSPRELDITQLPGSQSSWINPHFIYTHGYGAVVAEVAKITPEGQPVYLVKDMPASISTPSLTMKRPELYYGELQQEPVFVDTAQQEFNYPQGSENAFNRYQGKGGFPVSSLLMRAAAALHYGDYNILLTSYLTDRSRMMIHRRIRERLETLAPYLRWDDDPYLVITPEGREVWIADAYSLSDAYPSSREIASYNGINYIRNSVKATVDAYDGETHLYVFDPSDPIIGAYRNLFPALFEDASKMPAALRAHTRYPEELFRVQSDMYRVYHMTNPQAFYNNEDIWELSKYSSGQNTEPQPVSPSYVYATLPGETEPEFLLMTTFTPATKENLIGVMAARCDGEHLGQLVVMELSKQELILGPMQINARINQDENISKDLTLWNAQGSQALRGQTLVLPIGDTFLYISPIYLQATEARMPQLKKVVLALGTHLIYADSYEEALARINGVSAGTPGPSSNVVTQTGAKGASGASGIVTSNDPRLESVRRHMERYRELAGQGKLAEAGRELDAIQNEVSGQ